MDIVTFIQTLTPDLREEILLTTTTDVLDTLPTDLRAEAMEIRRRAAERAADDHGRLEYLRGGVL
jgi:hypothetical protein